MSDDPQNLADAPLADTAALLVEYGWKVAHRPARVYTINEIQDDKLRYLDDFEQQGFRFAKFPDQVLDVEKETQRFTCFGESRFGPLLIDSTGAVFVLLMSTDGFEEDPNRPLRLVNSSFEKFVTSYCTFMSMLFELRASCLPPQNNDVLDAAVAFDDALTSRLSAIDEAVRDPDTLWSVMAYGIGDGLFFFTASAHDYAAHHRLTY